MGLSILSDFKDEDLETMMDLGVKYSGEGSYAEPVSYSERYSNDFVTGRDLCDEAVARDYSVSNPHSTSWASALVLAAEAALSKEGHVVPLSLTYVLKCLPKYQEVGLNDVSPTDIMEFVIERGLMSKEAASLFDNDEDLCSADTSKYYFDVTKNDIPNKSGLMTFIAEGDPVIVLMAMDLIRLKTVNDVTGNDIYTGATDQPSLYGVMKEYDETKWTVTFNVVPCENIIMNLPVKSDNETNANYAGIAGYAMSLFAKPVPSTEPTDITPTESPTTEVPTTQTPTTQTPTTQTPTTQTPTTQTPTTQTPTTQTPTTQTPTTQVPTTQVPTTPVPTTQTPTTIAPGTIYVSEEDYPTLDLIPRDAQVLIFRSNSYPELTEVNLSGFTNLASIVFEIGSFANVQSVSIESSTLTSVTFNSNTFNGDSVDGSVTLYTPMLEKATFESNSLRFVRSAHLRGLAAPVQFCVENAALNNVDTIYYMNTHPGYASLLAQVMYDSGHVESISIVEETEASSA